MEVADVAGRTDVAGVMGANVDVAGLACAEGMTKMAILLGGTSRLMLLEGMRPGRCCLGSAAAFMHLIVVCFVHAVLL